MFCQKGSIYNPDFKVSPRFLHTFHSNSCCSCQHFSLLQVGGNWLVFFFTDQALSSCRSVTQSFVYATLNKSVTQQITLSCVTRMKTARESGRVNSWERDARVLLEKTKSLVLSKLSISVIYLNSSECWQSRGSFHAFNSFSCKFSSPANDDLKCLVG